MCPPDHHACRLLVSCLPAARELDESGARSHVRVIKYDSRVLPSVNTGGARCTRIDEVRVEYVQNAALQLVTCYGGAAKNTKLQAQERLKRRPSLEYCNYLVRENLKHCESA